MSMETSTTNTKKSQTGFALLITLIVVGVVVAIGVSVLDLSLKQVRLSTNAKDSEIAFHAVNAGMECARYWRRVDAATMERGGAINPVCFSGTLVNAPSVSALGSENGVTSANGQAFLYNYAITWQGGERCSEVTALVASSTTAGSGLSITGMEALVQGYPEGNTKVCVAGERCTVLSVRGYNKPCSPSANYPFGTVQREVLLQF